MKPGVIPRIVPVNEHGKETDITHVIELADETEAIKNFGIFRSRLLSPHHWHKLAGALTAEFTLADSEGIEKTSLAEVGDFIRINIPGPGPSAGEGYDWVRIHEITDGIVEAVDESIGLQVMPCGAPVGDSKDIAHFFDEDASSTFVIQRAGRRIRASYYGRNEIPNTKNVGVIDKLRNGLVATAAIAGISEIQWTALLKGLLSID